MGTDWGHHRGIGDFLVVELVKGSVEGGVGGIGDVVGGDWRHWGRWGHRGDAVTGHHGVVMGALGMSWGFHGGIEDILRGIGGIGVILGT